MKAKAIRKRLFSKSFFFSILFALALWVYTNLNNIYTTYIPIPLKIKIPNDRAIEDLPPEFISIEIRGSGWNLFNYMFLNSSVACIVDLSRTNISTDDYLISRKEILKNVQSLLNVEALDVMPEAIGVKTGKIELVRVPVEANIKIVPREGFALVGKVNLKPDSVNIRGNSKVVKNIKKWRTNYFEITNIQKPIQVQIGLIDSISNIIDLDVEKVELTCDIQQIAELKLFDIPVKIRGGSLPNGHRLAPQILSINIRGGINEIANLSPDKIYAYIDYTDIIHDSTGVLKPLIYSPNNIRILNTEPLLIYHYKQITKNGNLLNPKLANINDR
ncbi:MAG: CdaR family protein [Candidatus Kapabacteria bacterium]|nr:CdaR family protein [Candidatus Kapabacteria bacterium]